MAVRLGTIISIDVNQRTAEVQLIDNSGVLVNVSLGGCWEDLSLPREFVHDGDQGNGDGQIILMIDDDWGRTYAICALELNNASKINASLRRKTRPGEIYRRGPADQELFFAKSGDMRFTAQNNDGVSYTAKTRKQTLKANIHNFVSSVTAVFSGLIQRGNKILDTVGTVIGEHTIQVYQLLFTGVQQIVARLTLGPAYDDTGNPINSVVSGNQAWTILKVWTGTAGLQVSEFAIDSNGQISMAVSDSSGATQLGTVLIDKTGNLTIVLKGSTGMCINATNVTIGSDTPQSEQMVLGTSYYNWLQQFITTTYNAHTHPYVFGTTGSPVVQAQLPDTNSVLSNIGNIKPN